MRTRQSIPWLLAAWLGACPLGILCRTSQAQDPAKPAEAKPAEAKPAAAKPQANVPKPPPDVDRPVPEDQLKKITEALPTEAPAKPQKPRKLLVCTLATGFVHSSIPVGAKTFELMGQKLGTWETVISHDKEMFAPDKLAGFDAIIMESTTGSLFGNKGKFTPEEKSHNDMLRQSLVDFVKSGKGLVGVHAASDCSYDWAEYGEMIGGYFNGHPWGKVTYKIDDPKSPLTAMFPTDKPFELSDETYTFKKEPYSRDKLHILASIDVSKFSDADVAKENRKDDHDYALSWIHEFGKGRVFYAAHGHREEVYWNPVMLKHYLAGIQYALGDLPADATPSSSASAAAGK
jgi:type 1 glutamine amidotransferase